MKRKLQSNYWVNIFTSRNAITAFLLTFLIGCGTHGDQASTPSNTTSSATSSKENTVAATPGATQTPSVQVSANAQKIAQFNGSNRIEPNDQHSDVGSDSMKPNDVHSDHEHSTVGSNSMEPNDEHSHHDEHSVGSNSMEPNDEHDEGLRLCNKTRLTLSLAVGAVVNERKISQGWYSLEPKNCSQAFFGRLRSDKKYYFYAQGYNPASGKRLEWEGSEGETRFCIGEQGKTFEFKSDTACEKSRRFHRLDVGDHRAFRQDLTHNQ